MADKPQRQSWRMTRRELRKSLSRRGRKWLDGVWKATARTASEFEGLSPVTTVLGSRLVESFAAREQADIERVQHALRVAVVYGYAARMVLLEPTDQPSLKRSAFQLNQQSDVERLANDPATPKRLLDPVRSIAADRFDSVMTLPPAVWSGLVATATQKLQRRFASDDKKLASRELTRPRIEKMLRYGYVLRCLDETLDAEPRFRESEPDAEPETDEALAADARRGTVV
jgi:hypothetical protein